MAAQRPGGGSSSVTASQITDSTATGRSVLTAANAGAARSAIGAIASVAAAGISDAGTTGIALVQASTAEAARSAAGAAADATVTADAMTGSGWTLVSASSETAAFASSKLTISITAGHVTSGSGPGAYKAFSDSPSAHDALARVNFVTGNGEPKLNAAIWAGNNASNAAILICYANGSLTVGHLVGGSWTALRSGVSGPSSGQRTGGQLWLRLSRRLATWAAYWGVGTAGAVPTSWTLVWSAALADSTVRALDGGYVRCVADTEPGVVLAGVVDVLAIRRSVPAESL